MMESEDTAGFHGVEHNIRALLESPLAYHLRSLCEDATDSALPSTERLAPVRDQAQGIREIRENLNKCPHASDLHLAAQVIVACLLGLAVILGGIGEAAREPFSPACLEYAHGKSRSDKRTAWRLYQECARFLAAGIKKGAAANDQWDVQSLLEWARALQVCSKTDDPLLCAANLDKIAALTPAEPARPAPTPQVPRPQSRDGSSFQRPGPDLSAIGEGSERGLKESDDEKVRALTEALERGRREIEERERRRSWLDSASRKKGEVPAVIQPSPAAGSGDGVPLGATAVALLVTALGGLLLFLAVRSMKARASRVPVNVAYITPVGEGKARSEVTSQQGPVEPSKVPGEVPKSENVATRRTAKTLKEITGGVVGWAFLVLYSGAFVVFVVLGHSERKTSLLTIIFFGMLVTLFTDIIDRRITAILLILFLALLLSG